MFNACENEVFHECGVAGFIAFVDVIQLIYPDDNYTQLLCSEYYDKCFDSHKFRAQAIGSTTDRRLQTNYFPVTIAPCFIKTEQEEIKGEEESEHDADLEWGMKPCSVVILLEWKRIPLKWKLVV